MNYRRTSNWQTNEQRVKQDIMNEKLLAVCLLGLFSSAQGAENEQESQAVAPDLEFLEFLGQFETDGGEWVGPDNLLGEEFNALFNAATQIDSAPNDNSSNDDQLSNQQQNQQPNQ